MPLASLARLVLLAAIWGAAFLFMRIGVPVFGPGKLIALRVSIAAIFLLGISLFLKKRLPWRGNLRRFFIMGVLNSGLPFVLYAFAAQTLSASLLSIINATAPIFGAVIAAIWLRTPLTRIALIGLAISLAGVSLIVGTSAGTRSDGWWLAIAAALCAPLCYSFATSYARKHASDMNSFDQSHGSMWAASIAILPLALFSPMRQTPNLHDWAAVIALAVMCTGWAFMIFFRLIDEIGPARTLTVTFLIPVFGVLWGALFLDEPVTAGMIVGGLIVVFGTALANGLIKPSRAGT
ncbi:MAG TPA: DMT family transporter [Rhodocyclaceae bacterium]|nr:DMT family transporter [Rhodocyclaceae bacterium]